MRLVAMRSARAAIVALLVALLLCACGGGGGGDDRLYIMTRFWPATGSLEIESYWFGEDGVVVRNPTGDPADLDVAAERAERPRDVGTYAWDGDTLTMTFDGRESAGEAERDGDCFTVDMGTYCPVEAVGSETLDGTFSGGVSSRAGGGVAISSATIRFAPDGTYTLGTAGSISSTSDASSVSGGSSGEERGRYRFDGTALHLEPEGAAPRVISTFAYDDGSEGEQPRRLYFGGAMLKRIE